jgi:hypothetical protein
MEEFLIKAAPYLYFSVVMALSFLICWPLFEKAKNYGWPKRNYQNKRPSYRDNHAGTLYTKLVGVVFILVATALFSITYLLLKWTGFAG